MDEVEVSAALRDWSLNWKEVTDTCKASMVTSSSRIFAPTLRRSSTCCLVVMNVDQ